MIVRFKYGNITSLRRGGSGARRILSGVDNRSVFNILKLL